MNVYDLPELLAHLSLKDKDSPLSNKLANEKAREIAADFLANYPQP